MTGSSVLGSHNLVVVDSWKVWNSPQLVVPICQLINLLRENMTARVSPAFVEIAR